jgi:hypothetical protein
MACMSCGHVGVRVCCLCPGWVAARAIPPYSDRRAPANVCTLMVMMHVRMRMRGVETDRKCDSECGRRKRSCGGDRGGCPMPGRSCLACCDAEDGGKVGRLSAPAYAHALSPREAHPQRRGAARGCDGRVESVRLACARDGARRTESEAFKDDLRCGALVGSRMASGMLPPAYSAPVYHVSTINYV